MKKLINIAWLPLLLLLFSCEEVIEIDLNESNPQWVIEAQVDDQDQLARVNISQTGSYFEPKDFAPGTGASVILEGADRYDLAEIEPGKYQAGNIDLKLLEQYKLAVELDGKTYEGFSTLQAPVQIDSLSVEFRSGAFDEGYYLRAEFTDPPGIRNYLRFEFMVNGVSRPDIALYDDSFTDGNQVAFPLFINPFSKGDLVEVKVHALDFAAYRYWTGLSEILGLGNGGGESAAPANPPSNLSNDALGYFSVSSITKVSVKI